MAFIEVGIPADYIVVQELLGFAWHRDIRDDLAPDAVAATDLARRRLEYHRKPSDALILSDTLILASVATLYAAVVTPIAAQRLRVQFTVPINPNAPGTVVGSFAHLQPQNYVVSVISGSGAGVNVQEVYVPPGQSDLLYVELLTTEMTNGGTYAMSIAGPLKGALGETVAPNRLTNFAGLGDAPRIILALAIDKNTVEIRFSEPIQDNSAVRNPENYLWNNGLVTIEVLNVFGSRVAIRTTDQTPGLLYTLNIKNSFQYTITDGAIVAESIVVLKNGLPTYLQRAITDTSISVTDAVQALKNTAVVLRSASDTITLAADSVKRRMDWRRKPADTVAVTDFVSTVLTGLVPSEMANIGGATPTMVKNWNFGTLGNIFNIATLEAQFDPYTLFNTYNNGGQYGTNTVAPSGASALSGQPVDPTGTRYRQFTTNSMLAHVKPFTDGQPVGPAELHNGGNGSIYSKFKFPSGGSVLNKDIIWETRIRIVNPTPGHWFALWTLGNIWDDGPEMDVIEAFTAWDGLEKQAWHSNSVHTFSTDNIDYMSGNWWDGQISAGWPQTPPYGLDNWRVITWVYRKNNNYEVWFDGVKVQYGTMSWRVPSTNVSVNMQFAFDFAALHTEVPDYDGFVIPSGDLPITYEIDYSRIWERA